MVNKWNDNGFINFHLTTGKRSRITITRAFQKDRILRKDGIGNGRGQGTRSQSMLPFDF